MRQILSISMPMETINAIKKRVKKSGFNSISEYFKYLFSMDNNNIISEKELLAEIKQAREEYKKGKTIKANSIADLL